MKTRLLRLIICATVPALVLAGCSGSAEGDPTPTGEPSPSPTPVHTPTATASPSPADDADGAGGADGADGDVDEQDGVRTNAFNRLPDALADTSLVESETDPSTHLAAREYHSDDEDSRLLVMAYIPGNQDDGYTPVTGSSDSRYLAVINRGFEALGAPENEIIERSPSIETYDWECYEALETQGGTFDHSFCITTGYGRVIEVQRLTVHGLDEQARNAHMDTVLEELSAALADLGS